MWETDRPLSQRKRERERGTSATQILQVTKERSVLNEFPNSFTRKRP